MDYSRELAAILELMERESKSIHRILKHAPEGSLQIEPINEYLRICQITTNEGKRVRKGIGLNDALVKQMARKTYLTNYVKVLDKNISEIKKLLKSLLPCDAKSLEKMLPRHFDELPEKYRDYWISTDTHPVYSDGASPRQLQLHLQPNEMEQWLTTPYRANSFNLNDKRIKTLSGTMVRSKSEGIILDIYGKYDIPVHYDELIVINGQLKSPDFIALRKDGKLIFHEHCGLVGDPLYMRRHNEKMALYESVGIVPWDNLIVTYDRPDGGFDAAFADMQIKAKLL